MSCAVLGVATLAYKIWGPAFATSLGMGCLQQVLQSSLSCLPAILHVSNDYRVTPVLLACNFACL